MKTISNRYLKRSKLKRKQKSPQLPIIIPHKLSNSKNRRDFI
jgi:hypothetical protein